jgi:3-oxoacyl-[acyl-carrier protein] reductase
MIKKNKIALVCGGSYGLGIEITKYFLKNDVETIVLARNKNKLLKLKKKILSKKLKTVNCDLSKPAQVEKVMKSLKRKNININFLICNAGNGKDDFSINKNYQNFFNAYQKNFFTAINPIESLINSKNFINLKIIVISSIAGYFKGGAPLSYSLAKNSLINYCQQVSEQFAKKNIRINSISPGHILQKDNLWFKKIKKDRVNTIKFINKNVSLKKFCTTYDILNVVSFLISKESEYITGIDIKVDGNTK